ncbi:Hypothetical protein NTJ_15060 [Nesidiocoris tenuis]|uniref:Uncharacterized protein n=1 Tax=Nesidiocoris tenuis TaxID=355587 RepID=A0ABN7BEW2_9HEMI|nr:Hypothetical protein NTJ_15060 [Nesidiocoris tenuis]
MAATQQCCQATASTSKFPNLPESPMFLGCMAGNHRKPVLAALAKTVGASPLHQISVISITIKVGVRMSLCLQR